jgi:hypothetical protein
MIAFTQTDWNQDEKISAANIQRGLMLDKPLAVPLNLPNRLVGIYMENVVDFPARDHNQIVKCLIKFKAYGNVVLEYPLFVSKLGNVNCSEALSRSTVSFFPNEYNTCWKVALGAKFGKSYADVRPVPALVECDEIVPEIVDWKCTYVAGQAVAITGFRLFIACLSSAEPLPL